MITTGSIKAQLKTVFTIGAENPAPQEVILMIGSCRSLAWLNYLARYNHTHGEPFRIHFIDPFNYHWLPAEDGSERLVDLERALDALEQDARVLAVLRSATIFIHEHYAYYGMFNTSRAGAKNIYQFGMAPRLDICCPNFHDRFVLFRDQITFDPEIRRRAESENWALSPGTIDAARDNGLAALEKFYAVCRLSSFPEMEPHFRANWTKERFFWSGNHTAKAFTLYVFRQMNARFLHLPLDDAFWGGAAAEDLLASPFTPMTEYDVRAYGLTWPEQTLPLKP